MTVSSETNRSGPYNGNGVTTAFDYEFSIFSEDQIRVVKNNAAGVETTLVLGADYSVTGVGNAEGGQIICTVAPATGETITNLLLVPFTQETDLENQGAYLAEVVERALDLAAKRDLQLAEGLRRAVKLPASSAMSGDDLGQDFVENIDAVAGVVAAIPTVAGISADVQAVADIAADVALLADNSAILSGTASAVYAAEDVFTGDGSDTTWTLSVTPASEANVDVWVGGQIKKTSEYSVAGNVLTINPPVGNGVALIVKTRVQVSANDVYDARDEAVAAATVATSTMELRHIENVVRFGADPSGVLNSSQAFNDTKAVGKSVRVPEGSFKLNLGHNLSDGIYLFDHGAVLTKPDGSPSDAGLGYLQIMGYLNTSYARSERSGGMVIAPNIKIKREGTPLTAGGDETVMQEMIMWYDRQVGAGSGYLGGASLFSAFINFGFGGAPAGGCVGAYQARINVGDTENTSSGRHEHIAASLNVGPDPTKTQYKWNGYVIDAVIWTPTTVQEGFVGGYTLGIKKLNGFQTLDADHDGVFGFTAESSPFMGGYAAPMTTTYTMDVAFAGSGWAGNPATAVDGYHASATSAWKWVFFAGGNNGQWNPYGTHSKIDHGAGFTDYVFSGIEIFTAHPHATDPFALRIYEDAGKTAIGVNSPSGVHKAHIGNGSGQFDLNLKLYESGHATSKRAGIDLNGQASVILDTAGNGTADFGLFLNALNGFPLVVNASGKTTLGVASAAAAGAVVTINSTTELQPVNLKLVASGHATSERTAISFNDEFFMGTDPNGTNNRHWFIAKSGQQPVFQALNVGAGQAILYMDLPVSNAGLSGGQLWRNGNVVTIV